MRGWQSPEMSLATMLNLFGPILNGHMQFQNYPNPHRENQDPEKPTSHPHPHIPPLGPGGTPTPKIGTQKWLLEFLEALNGPLRCRRRFFVFFVRRMTAIFLEALNGPLRCRRRFFFFRKRSPPICLESAGSGWGETLASQHIHMYFLNFSAHAKHRK